MREDWHAKETASNGGMERVDFDVAEKHPLTVPRWQTAPIAVNEVHAAPAGAARVGRGELIVAGAAVEAIVAGSFERVVTRATDEHIPACTAGSGACINAVAADQRIIVKRADEHIVAKTSEYTLKREQTIAIASTTENACAEMNPQVVTAGQQFKRVAAGPPSMTSSPGASERARTAVGAA